MSEAERILKRAGGQQVRSRRHLVYLVGGERFTLHRGGKPSDQQELRTVRLRLRRLGLL